MFYNCFQKSSVTKIQTPSHTKHIIATTKYFNISIQMLSQSCLFLLGMITGVDGWMTSLHLTELMKINPKKIFLSV